MRRVAASPDITLDPFGELGNLALHWRTWALGVRFEFSSNNRALLRIAQDAFDRVPQHRWARGSGAAMRVTLVVERGGVLSTRTQPPRPVLSSGAGMLCGHVDSRNFVIIDPAGERALIRVGDAMLSHPELLRYELIEFAAITLATRTQGLVPLHAGCVGARGKGVLLLGSSGSGKSTLALHGALAGLDFLAEDSVFVQPATLRATGLSAYVHAHTDALSLIGDGRMRRAIRAGPRIQRRSGVRKYEIDLRRLSARLAPQPLRIVATVVLSARRGRGAAGLQSLTVGELRHALRKEQSFAVGQRGWREFERSVLRAGAYRLDRMAPADGVMALRTLLGIAAK